MHGFYYPDLPSLHSDSIYFSLDYCKCFCKLALIVLAWGKPSKPNWINELEPVRKGTGDYSCPSGTSEICLVVHSFSSNSEIIENMWTRVLCKNALKYTLERTFQIQGNWDWKTQAEGKVDTLIFRSCALQRIPTQFWKAFSHRDVYVTFWQPYNLVQFIFLNQEKKKKKLSLKQLLASTGWLDRKKVIAPLNKVSAKHSGYLSWTVKKPYQGLSNTHLRSDGNVSYRYFPRWNYRAKCGWYHWVKGSHLNAVPEATMLELSSRLGETGTLARLYPDTHALSTLAARPDIFSTRSPVNGIATTLPLCTLSYS